MKEEAASHIFLKQNTSIQDIDTLKSIIDKIPLADLQSLFRYKKIDLPSNYFSLTEKLKYLQRPGDWNSSHYIGIGTNRRKVSTEEYKAIIQGHLKKFETESGYKREIIEEIKAMLAKLDINADALMNAKGATESWEKNGYSYMRGESRIFKKKLKIALEVVTDYCTKNGIG